MKVIKGIACKDRLTKVLIQRIGKDHIPILKHKAIDLVAAQDLKYKNVKAVINSECSIDKSRNLDGVKYLIENNIKIFDIVDESFFEMVHEGDHIKIRNNCVFVNNIFYTYCQEIKPSDMEISITGMITDEQERKRQFVINTMNYMKSELEYFITPKSLPDLSTNIRNREVLIISRGRYYREDLKSIKRFIINKKPVIISVDGGADAITDAGLKSNIIIGDMDSVSDSSLLNCDEIIVHSYSNGHAPGLNRIKSKGLDYKLISIKGTSEDAALFMAQLKGASTIYLIGGHNCLDEFLEKGRQGMGSTVLLRLLASPQVIDLKGISTVTNPNLLNAKEISIFLLITVTGIFALFLKSALGDYIQKNLGTLFNIY